MAYGFDDFVSQLKFQMGQRPELEDVDGTNMYELWVNKAYRWLTTRNRFWNVKMNFYFPELTNIDTSKSTSDGIAYVAHPDSTLYVIEIYDSTNDMPLDWIHPKKYIRYTDRADTDAEGQPLEWTTIGDGSGGKRVYLHPTPDDEYTLHMLRRFFPSALSGTSETAIGEEWDEAILFLAAQIGHSWMGEKEDAEDRKNDFIDYVGGLIGIYRHEEKAGHQTFGMNPSAKRYGF